MLGTESQPLKVAIIGAGPSGMYAADALFKSKKPVEIHAFDRLPTPYGLLRGGVAPDHQRMKSVSKYYDRVASNPLFSFFGNVTIGKDVTIEQLKDHYDAIVVTCGAESDRALNIPGETLAGSYAATEFVGWYNGHPDYQSRDFNLGAKSVAIIGQGNVAIDVTRILAKSQEELGTSDITAAAMAALKDSTIETIHLIGRRGPVQAAFTQLEIKELGELAECSVSVESRYLDLSPADQSELEGNNKAKKNVEILSGFPSDESNRKAKHIVVHFLKSPVEILGSDKVEGIVLEHNQLQGEPGAQKARSTGKTETLDVELVFRSVGYRGVALPGVPFDEKRCVVPNDKGRVLDGNSPVAGMYVGGWIKRGPSGVLGTNKPDSTESIACLLEDLDALQPAPKRDTCLITELKTNGSRVITFDDWEKINAEEIRRGESAGKPREKFTSLEAVIDFLDA